VIGKTNFYVLRNLNILKEYTEEATDFFKRFQTFIKKNLLCLRTFSRCMGFFYGVSELSLDA